MRRLPQAVDGSGRFDELSEPVQSLQEKGLPAKTVSATMQTLKVLLAKLWHFILDAKGLKHSAKISYRMKKIQQTHTEPEVKRPVARSEQYYIDLIKRHPKDLEIYDQLGNFYIEARKYFDASNVYEYLVSHNPSNGSFYAKLGLSRLYLQDHQGATEAYRKAVDIDPSNPGRFYNLALAYQGMKAYKDSIVALKKAVELEPKNQKYNDLLFELESKVKTAIPLDNIHKKE